MEERDQTSRCGSDARPGVSDPSRLRFNNRAWVLLLGFLLLGAAQRGSAYSVVSHEELVDILWKDQIVPVLLNRFPAATKPQLRQAHAYAYGGCLVQDMGYYPFGDRFFSDLTHYVRSGDFVANLIRESADLNEYAFALGALAHYCADCNGHPFVNRVVGLAFPKLRAKYGEIVTYEDHPKAHLRTEFGFDMLQAAKSRYTSDQYHDFIGFEVSQPLLARAFLCTYGLPLDQVLRQEDLAIGTFRRAVSKVLPEVTRAALTAYPTNFVNDAPSRTEQQFLFNLSRAEYEREWGKNYRKPGWLTQVFGFLLRWVSKADVFSALAFEVPPPETEALYMESMNLSVEHYRGLLHQAGETTLRLPNLDCDTGQPARVGEYQLADAACARLLDELFRRGFDGIKPDLQNSLLAFFDSAAPPTPTRKAKKAWSRTESELAALRAGPGSAVEQEIRERLFPRAPRLESPKAQGEHSATRRVSSPSR